MFKRIFTCFILSLCLVSTNGMAKAKEKVLLDTDMVEAFDDGIAMLMLANSPKIELMGVTTVSGNSWAEAGTAYAIRQLEIAGRKDIPVATGFQYALRPDRLENIALERELFGIGVNPWTGAIGLEKPKDWKSFYKEHYKKEPTMTPINQSAVDFIVETVRKNPHEITIAAMGPCTNLAIAIKQAPDIIPLIKRVIYMGGSLFQNGNVTPAAEFNWWFDPEAARITVRAPFKEQIIVGLDVCEKVKFQKDNYDRFMNTLNGNSMATILEKTHIGVAFNKNPDFSYYVWDVLVSVILIEPEIITKEVTQFVDVNDQFGLSYGQSLPFPVTPPKGSQKARIILEIDTKRFWDMLNEKQYWKDIPKQ